MIFLMTAIVMMHLLQKKSMRVVAIKTQQDSIRFDICAGLNESYDTTTTMKNNDDLIEKI